MIEIELVRAINDGHACDPEAVVRVVADGHNVQVEGPERELIDRSQRVMNLRTGATIAFDDDPEEWVRGLAVSFRTPYLFARVLEDSNPLSVVDVARVDVREPAFH